MACYCRILNRAPSRIVPTNTGISPIPKTLPVVIPLHTAASLLSASLPLLRSSLSCRLSPMINRVRPAKNSLHGRI